MNDLCSKKSYVEIYECNNMYHPDQNIKNKAWKIDDKNKFKRTLTKRFTRSFL